MKRDSDITKKEYLLLLMGVAALYFLSGKLSFFLSVSSSIVTLAIFFAEGVSLAAVLIYGKRVWPGVFGGQLVLALSSGLGLLPSLLISAINSAEILLAYHIFRYLNFSPHLRNLHHLYMLFGVIIFILQPFSAILGNIVLVMFGNNSLSMLGVNLFSWWFGNVMGQLLITPMLLIFYRDRQSLSLKPLLILLLFLLFCYGVFFYAPIENMALLLSITIPLIVFILVYLGFIYAMIGVLILSLVSLFSMHEGVGIFTAAQSSMDNLININFYIFAHIFVIYVYGVLIGEKEEALATLARMNEELEVRVKEEVKKRQEKEELLLVQSRQAQMGEMISMIAHQWRQPLNTLSLLVHKLYIKSQLGPLEDTFIHDFKENCTRQIRQMSQTIEDFRAFFKPQKKRKCFHLDSMVKEVTLLLEPLFQKEQIRIELDIHANIQVNGFENELSQVLINLLSNAKDVILQHEISVQKRFVRVGVEKRENEAYIYVEDHAGGIDTAIIDRIFDPYFSTKEEKNGTGLGLYMSRTIIEKHMDGKLYVQNTEDGAMFVIVLKMQTC